MKKHKKLIVFVLCLAMLLLPGCAMGTVVDHDTGKYIEDANVLVYQTDDPNSSGTAMTTSEEESSSSSIPVNFVISSEALTIKKGVNYTAKIDDGIYNGTAYYGSEDTETADVPNIGSSTMSEEDNSSSGTAIAWFDLILMKADFTINGTPKQTSLKKSFKLTTTDRKDKSSHPVTWKLSGNKSKNTKITTDGKVTIGSNETATSITIKATSKKFSTLSKNVIVKISKPKTAIKKLKLTNATLKPKYSNNKYSYKAKIKKSKNKVKLKITKNAKSQKIKIKINNGKYKTLKGSTKNISVKKGKKTTVRIKVSQKNKTTSTYKIVLR